jgi:hypothetical protein
MFSVGITSNNQIKITIDEKQDIVLDIHNSEQLVKKMNLLIKVIKTEEEESKQLGQYSQQQTEYF